MYEQLVIDGLERPAVVIEQDQRTDLNKIETYGRALGWLITSYAIKWGGHPHIRQTKGVDEQGFPYSNVEIR